MYTQVRVRLARSRAKRTLTIDELCHHKGQTCGHLVVATGELVHGCDDGIHACFKVLDIEAVCESTAEEAKEAGARVEKCPNHYDREAKGISHVFLDEGVDLVCGATGGLSEAVEGFPVSVFDVEVEVETENDELVRFVEDEILSWEQQVSFGARLVISLERTTQFLCSRGIDCAHSVFVDAEKMLVSMHSVIGNVFDTIFDHTY